MKKTTLLVSLVCIVFTSFAQKSKATLRLEEYAKNGCDVVFNEDPEWNITYDLFRLNGDLAPNPNFVRRDPSSVLKVEGKYYVWYSYSRTSMKDKIAPWDMNDLYYATSLDGNTWNEQGVAVGRGPAGSLDHRSAFTTEVFYHEGTFYLIYQAASNTEGIFGRNTIAMAKSQSPDGPWEKLTTPLLAPTPVTGNQKVFDSNAVHDPCLMFFKDKFYLFYKGEGNEGNICGLGIWDLDKQVKWGVAISDSPTGPFVKSPSNPITNTGHEVCVWKSGEGLGIMVHQDGPEFATLQYADDGINFDLKGRVQEFIRLQPRNTDYPEAAGLYRSINNETSPVSGVSWGISHVLENNQWMSLRRFENVDKSKIVNDSDNPGIQLGVLSTNTFVTLDDSSITIYPNPVQNNINITGMEQVNNLKFDIMALDGSIAKTGVLKSSNAIDDINIEKGFYILKLTDADNGATITKSFIKM
ncbi:family 43 glycosylhydrolase [Aquimarina agarivorans]|uniref:family 43 glycosylhydrolase n=1 Tax=Aquimarina agarivorans TaxID=980584 RepID=UPI000248F27B|nr:family 43 glycosylhydrolase [Aquimarina agarivorans]